MLQLNATQMAVALHTAFDLDEPLFLWGSPGIGKSDVVRQACEAVNGQLVDVRLAMWDSVDVRGIPTVSQGVTCWNPPAILPFEGNEAFDPSRPIILFLDEILQAMPSVQSVAFQIALDRCCGEHRLMPNVRIVAASNKQSDRAGANRILTALANRFIHSELIVQLDAWSTWAWARALNSVVVAFVRMRPDLLNTFDPAKGDVAFCTPRSWAKACRIVDTKVAPDVRYALIAGTVGEGPAAELEAFMRTWENMPNIDALLLNPKGAIVPTDPATLFAVTAALAQRAEKGNFDSIVTYAGRIPDEYAMRCIKDSVKRKPEVQMTKAFNQFAVKHAGMWQD